MSNFNQTPKNTDKVVYRTQDIQEAVNYAARQEKKHPEHFVFVNYSKIAHTDGYVVYARKTYN